MPTTSKMIEPDFDPLQELQESKQRIRNLETQIARLNHTQTNMTKAINAQADKIVELEYHLMRTLSIMGDALANSDK